MASIGPVTSATLRELGLPVDIAAKEYTIPGLIEAIVGAVAGRTKSRAKGQVIEKNRSVKCARSMQACSAKLIDNASQRDGGADA